VQHGSSIAASLSDEAWDQDWDQASDQAGVYSMSASRGKRPGRRKGVADEPAEASPPRTEPAGRVPDLLRRVVGMGFSGLFLGEEVVRKALGETLPRDWVDFAAAQSERTRVELIDRVAGEIGRTLDGLDLNGLAERLLRGHAIEVTARVRFVPQDASAEAAQAAEGEAQPGRRHSLRIAIDDDTENEQG
jgi:hypothetical protein